MVYRVPTPHVCTKCGFEVNYSAEHWQYNVPILDDGPICPRCYGEWMMKTFPIMVLKSHQEKLKEQKDELTQMESESEFEQLPYQVQLCIRMLNYAVMSCQKTENKTASEIKDALSFFFTDEEIHAARDFITGRQTKIG
jgi:hypothetical protein